MRKWVEPMASKGMVEYFRKIVDSYFLTMLFCIQENNNNIHGGIKYRNTRKDV